jgi:NADPH-dependent 2,4-dienoyl-CoA reductase/sulfur reductase-like enzyme
MSERIVVVGGGLAGLRCAERLRELRFDGELVIVGNEPDLPYHRPALSKQLLTGDTHPAEMMLARLDEIDAEWRFNTPATHLQPGRQVVHLPGAEELPYDGLVIASGVEPRRLSGIPHGHPRVVVVRTLADAAELRDNLAADHGPVAVLGSGFIGCEVAASLRAMGREVTIIGRSANLLGEAVGKHIGQKLSALHRARGVRLRLGASIENWQTTANGLRLRSSDGWILDVSCVVVAVGTVPSISWLRGAKLPLDDGVVCAPTCHVLGVDNIVAAGDVAQWPNLRFDETPRRVEHWLNAVEMGRAAAENLLAGPQAARPFAPVPRFWSEQHGVRIQAGGIPKLGTDTVALASPVGGEKPVTGFVRKGRLVGVVGLDSPSAVLHWTNEIAEQNPVSHPGETEKSDAPIAVDHAPRHRGARRGRRDVVAGG